LKIWEWNGNNQVLFLKIDVEWSEKYVLEWAYETLARFDEVYIMVEDFVDTSIVEYLENSEFTQIHKVTPYNSFWYRNNHK
jgi:hypothetical protein